MLIQSTYVYCKEVKSLYFINVINLAAKRERKSGKERKRQRGSDARRVPKDIRKMSDFI